MTTPFSSFAEDARKLRSAMATEVRSPFLIRWLRLGYIITALFLTGATRLIAEESRGPYQQLIDNAGHLSDAERLHKLFQIDWDRGVREAPEFATDLGYPGLDDRWTDMSEGAIAQRNNETRWPLEVLDTIKRGALSPADQLNYDLFRHNVEESVDNTNFPGQYLVMSQLGGAHTTIPQVIDQMPHGTVKQYENILARLRAAPALIEQHIELLRDGVKAGVTVPKIILRNVPDQVLKVIPDDPMGSALLKPFTDFPPGIAEADRDRLKTLAISVYKEQLAPAYHRLHDFLIQDYIPHARDAIAWSALPQGQDWYGLEVREHTTTDMSPEEIHKLGLSEVARDEAEMRQVAAASGFKGDFDAFKTFLQTVSPILL